MHNVKQQWAEHEIQDYTMQFKRLLVNLDEMIVMDRAGWDKPYIGDHVEIISWDTQTNVQECVRVSKLPYLTVKDINPEIVGFNDNIGYWSYSIEVQETHLKFLQWHYKILN